ncbi:MAG: phosphatidylserine decarboxylase [Dongiaceae bacterium]
MSTFTVPPIHRDGWRFVALFAIVAALLFLLWEPLGWAGVILTCWCAYFFRDPARVTPNRPGLVISPADGVVQMIQPAIPPAELGMDQRPLTRISIFMNVFNVHVNRSPIDGEVIALAYRPGKFVNAALDKASEHNEHQSIHLRARDGLDICVVQIAGLIARRIKCDLSAGRGVRAGDRFGLIRFGSRVDVYLPDGVAPQVCVGQLSVAGETVLADTKSDESARLGEQR